MRRAYRRLGGPGTVLLAFVLTRLLALGATHAGARFMTPERRADWEWTPGTDLRVLPKPPALLAPLIRWDAPYYLALAKEGYPTPDPDEPVYSAGFFPLYPLAVRVVAGVARSYFWAAFLVSNGCALAAALFLLRVGSLSRRADGVRVALLFLASPGAHFLSYPYSEAFFAAALAAALWGLRRGWLPAAALGGAAASATRSPGVAAALAAVAHAPARLRNWIAGAASLGGLAAFMAFCQQRYGDALAFIHIQSYHRRHLSLLGPVKAFLAFDADPDYYLIAVLALYVAVRMTRRTPAWIWLTAWFLLLLPLATGTMQALIRYQATNLPLLCGVPSLCRGRRFWQVLAGSAALMGFEAFLYGKGIGHF